MTGKAPGRDEYGVASKGEAGRPRVPRQPDPSGSRDSPPLRRADRDRGDLQIGARFDLDEGDRTAPSRDEIDFAARYRESPRENRIALEAQQQRGDQFGLEAEKMRAASAPFPFAGALCGSPRGARERERARIDLPSRQAVLGGERRRSVLDRQFRAASRRFHGRARPLKSPRAPPVAPTTMTISPLGASWPAYSAASASSGPRRTSSCSLVNSRATAAAPRPKLERKVGERVGKAPWRFVKDERPGHGRKRVDALPPRGALGRKESLEKETVGRQTGDAEGGERGGGAWRGADREAQRRPPRRRAYSRDRKSAEFRRRK